MKNFILLAVSIICLTNCDSSKVSSQNKGNDTATLSVNASHFTDANKNISVTKVPCNLSNGNQSECYKIVTNSTPTDHKMGPWCPTSITDDSSAGGIWLKDGKVYDVDGAFIKNIAELYRDDTWKLYDDNGNTFVTKTEQDCIAAANPNVGEDYKNFCVECLPSYITEVSQTFLIPVTPVKLSSPGMYRESPKKTSGKGNRPKRPHGDRPIGDRPKNNERPKKAKVGPPSTRGIALNGVEFSAPAPLNHILSAYTLAPFDDAGGHINVHQGYHYHTATGISYSIKQADGHSPLIGYAMDGHGIYGRLDENGNEPQDLDICRGHFDTIRGYHYHVDHAGNNNFINCLHGAYAN